VIGLTPVEGQPPNWLEAGNRLYGAIAFIGTVEQTRRVEMNALGVARTIAQWTSDAMNSL
jgi:hypothetical protein